MIYAPLSLSTEELGDESYDGLVTWVWEFCSSVICLETEQEFESLIWRGKWIRSRHFPSSSYTKLQHFKYFKVWITYENVIDFYHFTFVKSVKTQLPGLQSNWKKIWILVLYMYKALIFSAKIRAVATLCEKGLLF